MALHSTSLASTYINLVGLSKRRLLIPPSCICCITTSSNNSLEESSCLNAHQEARNRLRTASQLHLIIANIHPGSSPDQVCHSLEANDSCNTLQLTHQLLRKLLLRFKDDWKSALGVFRWAQSHPEYQPSPELYDELIDTLGKMKQMEKMYTMLQEMQTDNAVSLNTIAKVMRRLCGAKMWNYAIQMFDDLGDYGFKKDTETMNMLLNSLCKEWKVNRARDVFLKLKSHIQPNAYTFNILIYGWCKLNRVDEAYWTIQEMKGYGLHPCVISYTALIRAYCKILDFRKVYELLDEMQADGCPPNAVTFTNIVSSLTNSQRYDEALQIFGRMKSIGCKPDTLFFNAYIHTLGRAGLINRAIHLFEFVMPANGATPNTSTHNSMIAMFCHHGHEEKALEYLQRMDNSPHCNPDIPSYSPLFKLYIKAKKFDSCRQLLEDMVNMHHVSLDLATYTVLINGLCRGGQCRWAYLLLREMIGKGIGPTYQTCRLLLVELKLKNMFDAVEVVQEYMKKMK